LRAALDQIIEVFIGKSTPDLLGTAPDVDVAKLAVGNVAV
jgi:hypothetical protein